MMKEKIMSLTNKLTEHPHETGRAHSPSNPPHAADRTGAPAEEDADHNMLLLTTSGDTN